MTEETVHFQCTYCVGVPAVARITFSTLGGDLIEDEYVCDVCATVRGFHLAVIAIEEEG